MTLGVATLLLCLPFDSMNLCYLIIFQILINCISRYVTGYVEFWNQIDTQCNTVSWAARNKDDTFLTTTLRSDMNDLVQK